MPVLSKEFLDNQTTVECGFTLKRVCDMIRTCRQISCIDKHSQHNSILNAKKNESKKVISRINDLTTTTVRNAKINEVKNKIHHITTTALTAAENEIPNVSNLFKKSNYSTKISQIKNKITTDHDHDEYSTTQEFNELTKKLLLQD